MSEVFFHKERSTWSCQKETLTHCDLLLPYAMMTKICVNIGSDNGLLPDSNKPLPVPALSYQYGPMTFSFVQFYRRYLSHQSQKLSFEFPRAQWVNFRLFVKIDGLVQDCSNSFANALKLLQSCTKSSTDVSCFTSVSFMMLIQLRAIITWYTYDITHSTAMTAELKSDCELTIDTPYLGLPCDLYMHHLALMSQEEPLTVRINLISLIINVPTFVDILILSTDILLDRFKVCRPSVYVDSFMKSWI